MSSGRLARGHPDFWHGLQRPAPLALKATYIGGTEGETLLTSMGLDFTKANSLLSKPGLLIIGAGGKEPSANALEAYAKNGGRVLLLGAVANTAGFTLAPKKLGGASASPPWPEAVGLSPSDLRLRSEIEIPLLAPEPNNVAANGLLGRKPVGRGVILAFPLTPDLLPANELGDDPARYYRW